MTKIFDTSIDIDTRLFIVLGWTALIANTVGFLSNLAFYGLTADTCFYGICVACILVIGILEGLTGKDRFAAALILLMVNVLEFPVMYYLYGNGRIVYMVLGVLGILVFAKKEIRIGLAILAMCFDAVIMIVSVLYPSSYVVVTPEGDLGAAVASFLIVMISLILIIILMVKQYEIQNQELRLMAGELKAMAQRDPLTQLYNRRYLTEYLEERMSQNDASFAVVLLDLDDFKAVNDTYGHLYGDEVLQNFSIIIEDKLKHQGIAARFGGEEFMLVMNTTDEKEIESLMEAIREDYEQFSMKTKGIRLTFSGGAELFQKEDYITRLFNAADEKLYEAKAHGKNRVVYHK